MKRFIGVAAILMSLSMMLGIGCGGHDRAATGDTSVNTLNGATAVATDSTFEYTFSQMVQEQTVTTSTFFIMPTPALAAAASVKAAYDGSICDPDSALSAAVDCSSALSCTLSPTDALDGDTDYTICLTDGISYRFGESFEGFMAQFTTGTGTAVTLSPADGATEVALDAAVTAVFASAITEPAAWATAFTLKADNAGESLCTSVTYDSTTRTATCVHDALSRGSSYTSSVSGVTTSGGSALDTTTATFATIGSVVISSAKLVRKDGTELETDGTLPIPRSATIKYTLATALTEEAQRTEFEGAVTVADPDGTAVAGTYAWAADYLSTVFTPTQRFAFNTQYTITVDSAELPLVNLSSAVGSETTFTTLHARDINGDGYDDVIVGASGHDSSTGQTYVFLGAADGISDCDLSGTCTADTTFTGPSAGGLFGISVDMAGDVNGDGYIDVIIGAYRAGASFNGQAYVLHGSANGIADCDLSGSCTPNASITGPNNKWLGFSVGFAGDVNGDGYDDVIVGAPGDMGQAGLAYVFNGSATGVGDCDLSDSGTADTTITGDGVTYLGGSVATAGDVNGDGYDDVIVGETLVSAAKGRSYVFEGSASGIADCDFTASCTPGATLTGSAADDYLGHSVSTAGDLNGDGYDDVIVGAAAYNSSAGRAYVFNGSADGISDCDLSGSCTAANTISGDSGADDLGSSVNTAGDVDGDGTPDIIVGSQGWDSADDHGRAYVYLGSGLTANMGTGDADAMFTGNAAGALLGGSAGVSTVGDINGDGFDDVIVGAVDAPGMAANGQAYIFNGSANGPSSCDLSGACTANSTFTGAAGANALGSVR